MSARITIAFHLPSQKYVHIDNVEKGNSDCICTKCNDSLIPRKGEINAAHFSHKSDKTCTGESLLHQLAKQIIVESTEMKISETETWFYSNGVAEKSFKNLRPDVTASHESEDIFFEIAVTNPKDENTKSFYRKHKIRSVEIDLRATLSEATFEQIKHDVLIDCQNKKVIFPINDISPTETKNESSNQIWIWALILSVVIFILSFFSRRNKKRLR